jgi:AcrR family transcriptional regulator
MNASAFNQRARTEEQKQHRRDSILDAAQGHFVEVGFEKFSMAVVSKLVGVSKGTPYLYVSSREEILLALCLAKLHGWSTKFIQTSPLWISDTAFVEHFYQTTASDNALVRLMSRLDSVIEHNVSLEVYVDAKRDISELLSNVAQSLAQRRELTVLQSFDAVRSLGALFLGTVQGDLGPRFRASELPEDVQRLMSEFSSHQIFVTNGCRIITGIRSEQKSSQKK